MTETCFSAVVVDPALRTLGERFYRDTIATTIPTRDISGNKARWNPRNDFHVTYSSDPASYSILLGEAESEGESDVQARCKMGLMALHSLRVMQIWGEKKERVILLVYISRLEPSMYLFYKDPDVERFYMRCIYRERNMFLDPSKNVEFLRMLFNFTAEPQPRNSKLKEKDFGELVRCIQQLPSTSDDEGSGDPSEKTRRTEPDKTENPSANDLAQLATTGYSVVNEPALREYPNVRRISSKRRDLIGKWTTDKMEHQILLFLQTAKSDTYQNFVIPVEGFLGSWIIMPYFMDLGRLQSLSLTGYMDLRRQLYEAIAFLHEQNVVHRDLKPNNLVVQSHQEPHGLLRVTDFSVAKFYKPGDPLCFGFVGTEGWTTNEVRAGQSWDPRSADVGAGGLNLKYLAKFSGLKDPLYEEILACSAPDRPTAAAVCARISKSGLSLTKRPHSSQPERLPVSKRRNVEPLEILALPSSNDQFPQKG